MVRTGVLFLSSRGRGQALRCAIYVIVLYI
jgi:hypothetical protein